jgi:hypothetical protein
VKVCRWRRISYPSSRLRRFSPRPRMWRWRTCDEGGLFHRPGRQDHLWREGAGRQ